MPKEKQKAEKDKADRKDLIQNATFEQQPERSDGAAMQTSGKEE